MLANWMLYCAAMGMLLSGGAFALERGLRALGRPTRWVWAGSMALTLAVPVTALYISATRAARLAVPFALGNAFRTSRDAVLSFTRTGIVPPPPGTRDLGRWDPALRLGWGASSATVLLGLAAMAGVLARRRRGWPAVEVDGVSVLVSPDMGPAVVGLLRSRIAAAHAAFDPTRVHARVSPSHTPPLSAPDARGWHHRAGANAFCRRRRRRGP